MTQNEIIDELRDVIANNQQFTTWTVSTPHLVELVNWAIQHEQNRCCAIVFSQCDSDNVAQRTVDAIRKKQ